jgi:hypothetical protein
MTPNSKVSRSAMIECSGRDMANFLSTVAMDSPAMPVKILFENEGVSCWTLNASKTVMLMLNRWSLDGLKVKQPCVIVCDPKEMADVIRAKSKGEMIRIKAEANAPIQIICKGRGGAEVMPADEEDCFLIPDRHQLPVSDDGKRMFPMFDMEHATWEATLSPSELRVAMAEMSTAKSEYVVITFDNKSEARAGHWSGKTTRSWSPITATTTGKFTASFTDVLSTVMLSPALSNAVSSQLICVCLPTGECD